MPRPSLVVIVGAIVILVLVGLLVLYAPQASRTPQASLTSRLDGTRWQVGGVAQDGSLEPFHPVPWSFDGKGGFQATGYWSGRYKVIGPAKLSGAIVHDGGATDRFTIEFDDDLTSFGASKDGLAYRHATRIAQPK